MLGFSLAFGTAILKAATDVAFKLASRTFKHDITLLVVQRAVEACIALVVIAALLVWWSGYSISIPALLTPYFVFLVASSAIINGLALYLNITALRISDVSVVSPMSQLTPAILLVTSPLMLGESVSLMGGVGVLLVVAGSYFIGVAGGKSEAFSFLKPIRALATDVGVRYALVASFLYGITSNIDKLGLHASDPFVWTFATAATLTIFVGGYLLVTQHQTLALSKSQAGYALVPGFTSGIGSILQMIALSVWAVPYVIAVKRLSALMSVFSGWYVFNEQNIGWRLVGALVMVAGTVLIVLYG
jgi:uncharacterized membrane protein